LISFFMDVRNRLAFPMGDILGEVAVTPLQSRPDLLLDGQFVRQANTHRGLRDPEGLREPAAQPLQDRLLVVGADALDDLPVDDPRLQSASGGLPAAMPSISFCIYSSHNPRLSMVRIGRASSSGSSVVLVSVRVIIP
jgi:hypothetical protein